MHRNSIQNQSVVNTLPTSGHIRHRHDVQHHVRYLCITGRKCPVSADDKERDYGANKACNNVFDPVIYDIGVNDLKFDTSIEYYSRRNDTQLELISTICNKLREICTTISPYQLPVRVTGKNSTTSVLGLHIKTSDE